MSRGPFLQRYGVLVALGVLYLVCALWQPGVFLKPEFVRNLLIQNAAVGMVAVGVTLVIVAGGIDLSVGSLMSVAAALGLLALNKVTAGGQPGALGVAVAALVSVASAAAGGWINGMIVTLGRVTPFIATLGGLVAYRSVSLVLADGGEVRSMDSTVFPSLGQNGMPLPFLHDTQGRPIELNWPIFVFLGVAVVGSLILERTVLGRNITAVGANEQAAYLAGIDTSRVKLATYVLTGVFVGVAAVCSAARMNSVATSQHGMFYELDAIAAVAIGGTNMAGGQGRIWNTVVGVLVLGVISSMLVTSGVSPYWQGAVRGAVILAAVMVQRGGTASEER